MDIDSISFWRSLPDVLQAISEAAFISLDLEMTGIRTTNRPYDEKPSLQEAYEEAKEAAETFQVLQLGLTCFGYDETSSKYLSRLFNGTGPRKGARDEYMLIMLPKRPTSASRSTSTSPRCLWVQMVLIMP